MTQSRGAQIKQPNHSIAAQSILLVLAPARRAKLGVDIAAGSPEEFDKCIRAQYSKWSSVAKQAGVKGE